MFTQPMSSPPGPQTAPSPVSSPPSRPSRLRGLSYLRSYTHNHLLSRDGHHGTGASSANNNLNSVGSLATGITTTTITAGNSANSISSGSTSPGISSDGLTRSSTAPAQAIPPHVASTRLTLVNSSPDPNTTTTTTASTTHNPPAAPPSATVPQSPTMTRTRAASTGGDVAAAAAAAAAGPAPDSTPSIRFSAYYDPRSTRPSLSFSPISRTLPGGTEVIRVGRYSERDGQSAAHLVANQPNSSPVGFKSKVVSRRHCEFWCEQGKWFIRDVKSSSGTFLNHIRLSPPSQDSKAFPINDGDIIQLGIDFKGGEEMIFRCVKMRVELNRGWQNKPNTFNMAAHKRLRTMATSNSGATATGAASNSSSQDCSICLNSIAPCQSLFVAPCSHTWHFKCVRSLLTSHQYPIFICPNCRAGADLEADVEEPTEEWEQYEEKEEEIGDKTSVNGDAQLPLSTSPSRDHPLHDPDNMDVTVIVNVNTILADSPTVHLPHSTTEPVPITNPAIGSGRAHLNNRTPSPPGPGNEGPITPRNDAGPWVFDGSAGRRAIDATEDMTSLDAAADMDVVGSDSSSR